MGEEKKMSFEALLQILTDSLEQKILLLNAIEAKCREQAKLLSDGDVSLEAVDINVEEKSKLITRLNKLDGGFETLYEQIREELLQKKDAYKEQIRRVQESISVIMEKSASIEAMEARNKLAVECLFNNRKKELQHKKSAASVARQYHNTAKNLNAISPQFMDRKK